MTKENLKIYLPKERGFCFGVHRALKMLNEAVEKSLSGESVYVYHPIIHNKEVLRSFEQKRVVFVDKVEDVPKGAVFLFSAHGVGNQVEEAASSRGLKVIDATCPFVKKVHLCAESLEKQGCAVCIIGKKGHDEVMGVQGRFSAKTPVFVVGKKEEVALLPPLEKVGYVTQTTLTFSQAQDIIHALKEKYPSLQQTQSDNICQATLLRQKNAAKVAARCDAFFVVGDKTSSNSLKLQETALQSGTRLSFLVENLQDFQKVFLQETSDISSWSGKSIGLMTSASAPEEILRQILDFLSVHFVTDLQEIAL